MILYFFRELNSVLFSEKRKKTKVKLLPWFLVMFLLLA